MFPYYVPAALGAVFTVVAVTALINSKHYGRTWPWVVTLVAALVLWIPALLLFLVIPTLYPSTTIGHSADYTELMGWQIVWIFVCIPPAFIIALIFAVIGVDGRHKGSHLP